MLKRHHATARFVFDSTSVGANIESRGGLGASRLVCAEQNLSLLPGCTKQGKGARLPKRSGRRKSAKDHGLLVEVALELHGVWIYLKCGRRRCLMLKVDCIVKDYLATSKFPPGLE